MKPCRSSWASAAHQARGPRDRADEQPPPRGPGGEDRQDADQPDGDQDGQAVAVGQPVPVAPEHGRGEQDDLAALALEHEAPGPPDTDDRAHTARARPTSSRRSVADRRRDGGRADREVEVGRGSAHDGPPSPTWRRRTAADRDDRQRDDPDRRRGPTPGRRRSRAAGSTGSPGWRPYPRSTGHENSTTIAVTADAAADRPPHQAGARHARSRRDRGHDRRDDQVVDERAADDPLDELGGVGAAGVHERAPHRVAPSRPNRATSPIQKNQPPGPVLARRRSVRSGEVTGAPRSRAATWSAAHPGGSGR